MSKPRKNGTKSRNPLLTKGVRALSRSGSFHLSGRWAKKVKDWKDTKKVAKKTENKVKQFGKKGESRTILPKARRFYPTEDVKKPLRNSRARGTPAKLRKSITPGTVLILLSGRFRARRVVFLKQLPSGLLLVTGPYALNGVPLRRVNQSYVIATTTKVDLTGFKAADKFDDAYFKRPLKQKQKKTEAEFFAKEKKEKQIKPERVADQKAVDAELLKAVEKTPLLKQYLASSFSLKNGDRPHDMKF